jgi:hypothetical protein
MGVLGICATYGPRGEAHTKPSDVTYLKDVAPILEKRCVGCHASGTRGLALDSYDRARQSARAIRESVLERRMPPWPAAPGFGDFKNDRTLTPIEIELLVAWADGRTPRGSDDRAAVASAPAIVPAFASSRSSDGDSNRRTPRSSARCSRLTACVSDRGSRRRDQRRCRRVSRSRHAPDHASARTCST